MTKILIKKLSKTAIIPKYETQGASGVDISANINEDLTLATNESILVPTGIAVSIPQGFEIQIRPRSGLAAKKGISVLNTPGTIDADYRGEIKVILINHGNEPFIIRNGDRIAQMVVCPIVQAKFEQVDELSDTERGSGGFGSTGV
ncbi:MAG: dUTP diphosphatase [Pelagibacteraceae bacterium]|jgi:dUTP pyrophosphatase